VRRVPAEVTLSVLRFGCGLADHEPALFRRQAKCTSSCTTAPWLRRIEPAVSFCEAALPVKSDVISLQEGDRCVLQLSLQQLSSARFLTLLSALISGSAWAAGARGSCDGAGAPS